MIEANRAPEGGGRATDALGPDFGVAWLSWPIARGTSTIGSTVRTRWRLKDCALSFLSWVAAPALREKQQRLEPQSPSRPIGIGPNNSSKGKPFSYPELKARIGAVLRRRTGRREGHSKVGELTIDPLRWGIGYELLDA